MEAFYPARGCQRAVEGFAFRYGLRCMLVVFWGERACELWYCVSDVPVQGVEGSGYRYRGWIEQGFGQWRRGGWGWHWMRVEGSDQLPTPHSLLIEKGSPCAI